MPDRDVVKEARALLTKCAPSGKITNGADAYLFDMQGPRILSAMADEIESLTRQRNEALDQCADLHRQLAERGNQDV